ncbi:MAG: SDR family NAD(P)-dependent oxidoreductase, partial [Mycolicibacterium aromaticivorans]|nr:SDR family NAD(P)-dependent oxidoreductase [Mycolicibacterium aromaticivorans]
MEISGKKVVVVGGASGFGRASAELLASHGAKVAILDRKGTDGPEVASSVGGPFMPVDVTDFAGTEKVLAEAVEALGGLHVVLTTAGGGVAEKT